ncbi:acylphosphatase [Candidatus Roizmanbacteria bacterium CG02_land_8_20_14_3_00_36_15]|uniref:acylphosphatase n=2 Tax=Candidatus Roizmaniibacteriota TaxID=1752723 RepID=A0A2M8KK63_9BACT|nr:MAG: acylphosphatase [Candidatus Roizmanbacteria bacterium CG03_land_8_20_14_0_80_36_21]PIV37433.1 MAG: acylphosphatase [Candidatus Roizmanbacteria bacterium CG02_land_8_20_14_3_00_36_15]PIY70508.1 MAG: acylphosphatase [Candidatus Roizmanbacteria bacterium CG_4_10_14_0_8_um_filter_36_36]PJA52617.1 MAG: acylphosphatase [Candidatus Roizmanbacteria bacterium CG_4_9_14_3_um_filter_36_11]PJC81462.1 MAG: acylphosphatase [Candidatus Roizmanbacteria bacterium CG_4_8_14_3_um_filter_36_10]PJE60305.1 
MLKQVHLYIKGDIIGVGFRAWTRIQAKINGVTGWVRNNFEKPEVFGPGGGVEAIIQGEEQRVNKMLETIKKGPPVSRVEEVEVFFEEPKEVFNGFEIRK